MSKYQKPQLIVLFHQQAFETTYCTYVVQTLAPSQPTPINLVSQLATLIKPTADDKQETALLHLLFWSSCSKVLVMYIIHGEGIAKIYKEKFTLNVS